MTDENKKGVVLIVVLWVLVILSVLAMGLSRQTAVALQLTRSALASARTKYVTLAALNYAVMQISRDSGSEKTKDWDNLFQCGIALEDGEQAEDIFRKVELPGGTFDIYHFSPGEEEAGDIRYGFAAEESRINLNAIDFSTYRIVEHLLAVLGFGREAGRGVASAIVDWRDENDEVFNAPDGAEEDYYTFLDRPYHCKNAPFESIEELKLVRGVTDEIFNAVRTYVTVFPAQGSLLINVNTAPAVVLRAWARNYCGAQTNTDETDADALADKILSFRSGEDGQDGTADDRRVVLKDLGLNASENAVAAGMARNWTESAQSLRMCLKGKDALTRLSSQVEVVISREDGRIVFWKRK